MNLFIPVKIDSIPPKADIYIDGKKVLGKTPFVADLAKEKHTIKLELNGYPDLGNLEEQYMYGYCNPDFSKNVQNGIDSKHWIIKPMTSGTGYEIKGLFWQEVDIRSNYPDTAIFIDEIFMGTAPVRVRLNSGIHIVKMKQSKNKENVQIINVPLDREVVGYISKKNKNYE